MGEQLQNFNNVLIVVCLCFFFAIVILISEGTTTGTDQEDDRRRVSCVEVSAHQVPLNVLIDERKRKCGILRAVCCFVYFTLAAPAAPDQRLLTVFTHMVRWDLELSSIFVRVLL